MASAGLAVTLVGKSAQASAQDAPPVPKSSAEFDIDDIVIAADNATPLALLLNELVANSMKYAFNGRSTGRIVVRLKKAEAPFIELSVTDDGSGFDGKPEKPGMGTKLIKAFVSQMKGEARYLHEDGTVFRARLNIAEGDA